MALNDLQCLIDHETKRNETKRNEIKDLSLIRILFFWILYFLFSFLLVIQNLENVLNLHIFQSQRIPLFPAMATQLIILQFPRLNANVNSYTSHFALRLYSFISWAIYSIL